MPDGLDFDGHVRFQPSTSLLAAFAGRTRPRLCGSGSIAARVSSLLTVVAAEEAHRWGTRTRQRVGLQAAVGGVEDAPILGAYRSSLINKLADIIVERGSSFIDIAVSAR